MYFNKGVFLIAAIVIFAWIVILFMDKYYIPSD